jgi:hypothetical protein
LAPVSSDLLAFIRTSISSVWALELLLLLKREDRAWTDEALVKELRASDALVADGLAVFETSGLVRRDGGGSFIYDPASPVLRALADELEKTYRERPVSVVRAIVSLPNDKLQNFADAFRFRGGST